jgi:hypothetical protein
VVEVTCDYEVLDCDYEVLDCDYEVLDCDYEVLDCDYEVLDCDYEVLDCDYEVLDCSVSNSIQCSSIESQYLSVCLSVCLSERMRGLTTLLNLPNPPITLCPPVLHHSLPIPPYPMYSLPSYPSLTVPLPRSYPAQIRVSHLSQCSLPHVRAALRPGRPSVAHRRDGQGNLGVNYSYSIMLISTNNTSLHPAFFTSTCTFVP